MILISIIVPVYKVEKYIEKCIETIREQTFKNLEIILVDDGSPDRCPEVCDYYAQKDSRIKVIHKKNGGLSEARNSGLEIMTGEYVAFIDSDDYIDSNYIFDLYKTINEEEADIVSCNYYQLDENYHKLKYRKKIINSQKKIFDNIDAIKDVLLTNSINDVITCNKLYKSDLFFRYSIRFPVGKIHEDNFTTYKLFYYAKKIVYIEKPLYYYRRHNDSITANYFSLKRLDMLEAASETKEFIKKYIPNLLSCADANYMVSEIMILNLLVSDKKNKRKNIKIWRFIKNDLLSNCTNYFFNKHVRLKQKIYLLFILAGFDTYYLFRKIFFTS
ncbi:glycosyltransferase family 2 protein [Eubacterium callanderi]|uniref:glycosyltransferase family 2 protein n=2 Tax=Eubacterium callanderi TaxID=53442 RepID=UPI0011DD84A3|nr:glycosyltransferase [Eubacterium callanderi]WPK76452.1 Glycosyltransferase GlyG [Eubacterium callanderi]